jgi:putative transposase
VQRLIEDNPQESRKKWMFWMMERAGSKKSNIKGKQFWQQHNKPIELWSPEVIIQKVDYLPRQGKACFHQNPIEAGFVTEPYYWKCSGAIDYSGRKGLLEIDYV